MGLSLRGIRVLNVDMVFGKQSAGSKRVFYFVPVLEPIQ